MKGKQAPLLQVLEAIHVAGGMRRGGNQEIASQGGLKFKLA